MLVLRLHNYPDGYAAPLRFGDAVVEWSPRRDTGGMTMRDRSTAYAVTVNQLLTWCEAHRATAARVHRTDADHTEQTETSNLKFDNGPFRSWWPRRRALVVAAPPGAGGGRAAARRSSLEARW